MIRRACALAGLLAVILQGSAGGHMLLVEHARCPEHGELVHADATHHHALSVLGKARAVTLEGDGDHDSDTAHEHCALTADRRDAVVALGGTRVSALASNAFERAAPFLERFVPAPARFRIAPKTSPPA